MISRSIPYRHGRGDVASVECTDPQSRLDSGLNTRKHGALENRPPPESTSPERLLCGVEIYEAGTEGDDRCHLARIEANFEAMYPGQWFGPEHHVVGTNIVGFDLDHRQIDFAIFEPLTNGATELYPHIEMDLWVHTSETCEHICELATTEVFICAETDHASEVGSAQMFNGIVVSLEHAFAVHQQVSSVWCRLDLAPSFDQLESDPFFEPFDLPADRTLCHPETSRSLGERAGIDNGLQGTERFHVQLHSMSMT